MAKHTTGPRVRTVCKDKLSGTYRYKGYDIEIDYDQRHDGWYIVVMAPNGMRDYDGWWRNSSGKTHREAVLEALSGSMLWPNTGGERTTTAERTNDEH